MQFYVTVRAVNRSFRFVPKRAVSAAIRYVLAATLEKFREKRQLVLHEFVFMSNHYHLLGTDIAGCLPDFMAAFNSLLSRQLNAMRGINGTNIEKGYGLVEIAGQQRVVEHAIYTLANPVRALVVAKSKHWPGQSSLRMEYGVPETVERPTFGLWKGKVAHAKRRESRRSGRAQFADRCTMPKSADLVIDRPDIMRDLDDGELRGRIREGLGVVEEKVADKRRQRGIRIVGRAAAAAASFLSMPGRTEEMFSRRPRFSASSSEERTAMARAWKQFIAAYNAARDAFAARAHAVVFPYGTWLLRRRCGVLYESMPARC